MSSSGVFVRPTKGFVEACSGTTEEGDPCPVSFAYVEGTYDPEDRTFWWECPFGHRNGEEQ